MDDPRGLYNLDESAFTLAQLWKRVIAVKGTHKVKSFNDGDAKASLTVLAAGNAAGLMLPPLILYDGKLHLSERFEGTEDKCVIGVNKSGWMDCPIFADYVKKILLPSIVPRKVSFD